MLKITDLNYLETLKAAPEITGGLSRTVWSTARVAGSGNIFAVGQTTTIAWTGSGSFKL
jgi:hypothetical protein